MAFPSSVMSRVFSGSPEAQGLADFLLTREVQQIQFRLGYLRRTTNERSRLAAALSLGVIQVKVDATTVTNVNSEAVGYYDIDANCIFVKSGNILSTPESRGIILHECSHAIRDMRGGSDAIRHDEAAAFICEAMYHEACGRNPNATVPDPLCTIASALRGRNPGRDGVPHATREEIILARRTVGALGRETKPYTNHHYFYDGV